MIGMCIIDRRLWVASAAACFLGCASADPNPPAAQHGDAGAGHAAALDASSGDARVDAGTALDAALPIPEGCPLTPPTSCPTPEPHYADVEPIFEERCFACHDGTGEQWGLTSYEHVADWFSEIRAAMIACTMPPLDSGLTIPTSERLLIVQWIRCNYPK
jgi:hypothetical protein